VNRILRRIIEYESLWSARGTLAGIDLVHMLKKGQMLAADGQ